MNRSDSSRDESAVIKELSAQSATTDAAGRFAFPDVPFGSYTLRANTPGGADAYASWLDRMQRARARQAAITRNLYTWSNYKNWADQVRDSWAATEPTTPAPNGVKPKK